MRLVNTRIRLTLRDGPLVTLFSSASFMALVIASVLTLFSTAVFAGIPAPTCPAVIQNQTLGCTTAAITIAQVDVVAGQNTNCLAGSTTNLDLELSFNSNKNASVYDVGVWFAQDGLAIDSPGGAQDCISKPVSFDLFGEAPDAGEQVTSTSPLLDGDACADTLSQTKGITFIDTFGNVTVDCDAALGGAPLEAVVGWKTSGGGATCSAGNLADLSNFNSSQCSLNTQQVIPLDVFGGLTIVKTADLEGSFDFSSTGACVTGGLINESCVDRNGFSLADGDSASMEALLGDEISVAETDDEDLVSISCTIDGTQNAAVATIDVANGNVLVTLTGDQPFVTCVFTNTDDEPAIGSVTVFKEYGEGDNNDASVNILLSCDSGGPETSPLVASPGSPAEFTVSGFDEGVSCTATEETVPAGYTVDESDCTSLDPTSDNGVASCTITNTLNTGTVIVSKTYSDDNTNPVNISLTCTSGGPESSPLPASPGNAAEFTVTGFDEGATCTATEAVPEGYEADETACTSLDPTADDGSESCTITNTFIQQKATFWVTKDFVPDNSMEVEVFISCNDGLPLNSHQVISENSDGVTFIVELFTPGNLDCEITEVPVPTGYDDSYLPGDVVGAGGDAGSLGNDGGCQFFEVVGGDFTCEITNTAQDAVFEVNKVWDLIGEGGDRINQVIDISISCTKEILSASPAPDSLPGFFQDRYLVRWLALEGDTTVRVTVDSSDGTADCRARERIFDDSVEIDNPCRNDRSLTPGQTTFCTMTNTVFFEGIPTLNQYGLAILALLMLGIGAVGFRRFG